LKLCTLYGVKIYLNPFFLALLGLFFIAGILDKGLVAFGVVLVHELVHAIVAKKLGVAVSDVELLPFGGVTRVAGDMAVSPLKEVYIAIAGPLSNLSLFLLGLALKNYGIWHDTLSPFFLQCNALIALFNILPALPLDGGRVYRAYLAGRIGVRDATYRAAVLGQALSVVVVVMGAVGLLLGLAGLDIIITGGFLVYAATREKAAAPYLLMSHLMQKTGDLEKNGVLPAIVLTAGEKTPLGQIVRLFMPGKFHFVMIFTAESGIKAVLPESKVIEALLKHGLEFPVGEIDN